jgi:hypothetical protein
MKFDLVLQEIRSLRQRVKQLELGMEKVESLRSGFCGQAPSLVFLSVSEQRTFEVLKGLTKPATAGEAAKITGRERATESMHLNHLFRRNMLLKGRSGRQQYFLLKREYRDERQALDP